MRGTITYISRGSSYPDFNRGDHIVPSFEELFPGLKSGDGFDGTKRKKHIGTDYYQVDII